jgi:hypothetical protein
MSKNIYASFFILFLAGSTLILSSYKQKPLFTFHSPKTADDPFGLIRKKAILSQLFGELPKNGMPSAANPSGSRSVYVFLVGKKNVSTYLTDLLPVQMYSDSTWPFSKDVKRRFANAVGLPLANVALAGFFTDSLVGRQVWKAYSDKVSASGINRFPVAFLVEPDWSIAAANASANTVLSVGTTKLAPPQKETNVVNLPDVTITGNYRPTIGILPIIDASTTLNQQFLVYQYLKDNPVLLYGKDTLVASLTDYRAYTQFALGGTISETGYSLKLWQKDKHLATIVVPFEEKQSLDNRLTSLARQLGRILSGGSENYRIRENPRTRNLLDDTDVIKSEIRRSTEISQLFPNSTTHYIPPTFSLPDELRHLSSRQSNLPFMQNPSPNAMAQMVRGIYQQVDEKQFFFTNTNIPSEMKESVKRITQPTSRRIGSALSYVAVGDAFLNGEKNLDGAACSYYSALLLSHNLAASTLEKASVKRMVYQRMKQIADIRQQPHLSALFGLAANLNESFTRTEFAQAGHREYYENLKKLAENCAVAENKARQIRAEQRTAALMAAVAGAAAVAQSNAGRPVNSYQLQKQVESFYTPSEQTKADFVELMQDIQYENFNIRDESDVEIELNQLYLAREILWHLHLRKDQDTVGKWLFDYAADKPSLKIALEEYLAESDATNRVINRKDFLNRMRYIETQSSLYESRGRKLPAKVMVNF